MEALASAAHSSFGALLEGYSSNVRDVKQLVAIRGALVASDDAHASMMTDIQAVSKRLVSAEASFLELKNFVDQETEGLTELEAALAEATALRDATNHMMANLPPHLPGDKPAAAAAAPVPTAEPAKTAAAPPAPKSRVRRAVAPVIPYTTVSELRGVPKYIKGRLTLPQMNPIVDAVNALVYGKYLLMSKTMTRLRGKSLAMFTKYVEQEDAETKGRFFFTDVDVRDSENVKFDSTTKAALGTLSHLGRLKKAGGGGKVRYFVTVPL